VATSMGRFRWLQITADCKRSRPVSLATGSTAYGLHGSRSSSEIIVYDAPKSTTCFVARQDEVTFLKPAGYRRVRAIGLPIIYTQPSGLQRIPKVCWSCLPTRSRLTF